jgi:hypothetical protein
MVGDRKNGAGKPRHPTSGRNALPTMPALPEASLGRRALGARKSDLMLSGHFLRLYGPFDRARRVR